MVVVYTKPEASYASNRLTRNYHGGPPLTTAMGWKIGADRVVPKSKQQDVGAGSDVTRVKRPEPATDDDPVSGSDEYSDSEIGLFWEPGPSRKMRASGMTLGEKLSASADESDPITRPASSSSRVKKLSQKSSLGPSAARQSSQQDSSLPKRQCDSDDDELSFGLSQKRHKGTSYINRKHAGSSSTTERTRGHPSSPRSKNADSQSRGSKDAESKFRVPKKIELDEVRSSNRSHKAARSAENGARNKKKSTVVEQPPGPQFKFPPTLHDTISDSSAATSSNTYSRVYDDDDALESPLSSLEDILDARSASPSPPPAQARCPLCLQPVDPDALAEFNKKPRRGLRARQTFCDNHTRLSAEKEYRKRGYPQIDWETFEERISRHFSKLDELLTPGASSFYHNLLETALKSGKAKNFKLSLSGDTLEIISCGYYGSRGAAAMLDAVTRRFSRKIRRLAATSKVVNTAGVAVYAQSVLVPELTVLLVKEDMGVNDDEARQIIQGSIEIGEKINFALNDVVPVPEKNEEEDEEQFFW